MLARCACLVLLLRPLGCCWAYSLVKAGHHLALVVPAGGTALPLGLGGLGGLFLVGGFGPDCTNSQFGLSCSFVRFFVYLLAVSTRRLLREVV